MLLIYIYIYIYIYQNNKYFFYNLHDVSSINGNKTETERDVETLVDYRNKSTATTRKVTLENKIETERDVG